MKLKVRPYSRITFIFSWLKYEEILKTLESQVGWLLQKMALKQQVLQEFFARKVSFSWKTAKLDFFVLPEWENQQKYRNYLTYLESRQHGTLF